MSAAIAISGYKSMFESTIALQVAHYTDADRQMLEQLFNNKLGNSTDYWGIPIIDAGVLNTGSDKWRHLLIYSGLNQCQITGRMQILVQLHGHPCILLVQRIVHRPLNDRRDDGELEHPTPKRIKRA